MAEITLQQIADLMDQKLAAQESRMDQKLAAQTAQVAEMMDQKLATQEARMDQKLAATLKEVHSTVSEVVQIIGEQMDQLKTDIIRENRVLAEQIEGRKIESLYEESQSHKAKLDDHENRIIKLEAAD